jgi:hypothetical protein
LQVPQVKIVYLLRLAHHLPLYVMQQENPHSSIAVKEISESALQSLNAFQVFAIQYQLVHH